MEGLRYKSTKCHQKRLLWCSKLDYQQGVKHRLSHQLHLLRTSNLTVMLTFFDLRNLSITCRLQWCRQQGLLRQMLSQLATIWSYSRTTLQLFSFSSATRRRVAELQTSQARYMLPGNYRLSKSKNRIRSPLSWSFWWHIMSNHKYLRYYSSTMWVMMSWSLPPSLASY